MLGVLFVLGVVVAGPGCAVVTPGWFVVLDAFEVDGVVDGVPGVVAPGVVLGVDAGLWAEFVLVPGVRLSVAPGELEPGVLPPGVLELGLLAPGVLAPGPLDPGVLEPGVLDDGVPELGVPDDGPPLRVFVPGELCCGTDGRLPGPPAPPSLGVVRGVDAGVDEVGPTDEGGPLADGVDWPGVVDGVLRGGADDDVVGLLGVPVPPDDDVPPEFGPVRVAVSPPVDAGAGELGMAPPLSPRGADVEGSEVVVGAELVCVGADAARLSTWVPMEPPPVDDEPLVGAGPGADCGCGEVTPPGPELPPLGAEPPGLPPLSVALGDGVGEGLAEGLDDWLLLGPESSKSLRPGLSLRDGEAYELGLESGELLLPESGLGPELPDGEFDEELEPELEPELESELELEPEFELDDESGLDESDPDEFDPDEFELFELDEESEPESLPVPESPAVPESLPVLELPADEDEPSLSGPLFA